MINKIKRLLGLEEKEEVPFWEKELSEGEEPSKDDLIKQLKRMQAAAEKRNINKTVLLKQITAFIYLALIVSSAVYNPFALEVIIAYLLILPLIAVLSDYILTLKRIEDTKYKKMIEEIA